MKRWPIYLIVAALLVAGCSETSVFELKTGDCFNRPGSDEVSDVKSVDCAKPHDYEIFGGVDQPGDAEAAYPGASAIEEASNVECAALFEPFVGTAYDDSELYIYYLAPTAASWAEGDREILCALYLQDEQLTGSMEGSAR